jgi:multidrug efflux pump subunit AcrB
MLLKPRDAKKDWLTRALDLVLGWFFRLFNRSFTAAVHGYTWAVRRLLRLAAIALLIYAGLLLLTFFGFKTVPTGFIPTQDQGYLIAFAQLPDGASLQRSEEVRKQMSEIARKIPGIIHTVEFTGYSGLDGTNRNNTVTAFLTLAPFEERVKDPRLNGFTIMGAARQRWSFHRPRFAALGMPVGSRFRSRIVAAPDCRLCKRRPTS